MARKSNTTAASHEGGLGAESVSTVEAEARLLLDQLVHLRQAVLDEAQRILSGWQSESVPGREDFHLSASNLAQYLALRHHDLREIQAALRPLGLSSLGRSEAQVMQNLDAVIATLALIAHEDREKFPQHPPADEFGQGARLLEAETHAVLGKTPPNRRVRMMVTLPSEAAQDPTLVRNMLLNGMNIARINCAHDTADDWAKMIAYVRAAENTLGIPCKISMDLGGPKLRTAAIRQPKGNRLKKGDVLLLTADAPKKSSQYPVQVQCTLAAAIARVEVGLPVWFDDGKIGAIVTKRVPQGLVCIVTHASDEGEKLKPDKGVNFPGTNLDLSPLTEKDLQDLDFVVAQTDIINYSFVQSAEDIQLLQAEIAKRNPTRSIALIAKVETARAVENLPAMIAAAGGRQPFGVMIARGDLAVEIGFERMAEIQEEILWVCEAAHVPVVWATQVLETLAKEGRPTRAEMTDAAMAERAECVMLNKGRYILDAMKILDGVLVRMQEHQSKKVAQLRALRSW
jgi:pyruvate kinase